MIFKEFGCKSMPVIILIHGGGLSWWSWKRQIDMLKEDYCVVTPVIDGHGEDYGTTFLSIKDSAGEIIEYIKENYGGKVFAICGLSIGAQIVVDVLSRESDITDYAVIESALVYPMKMAVAMTVPMYNMCYGLIKKRWYAKLQAKTLNVPDESFENYFGDSCKMTKESLINITKSNGDYPIPKTLHSTSAKTLILVGEKELPIMKKSAALLHDTIDCSILKVIEKSGHGEISLVHPDRYVELLKKFISNVV